MGETANVVLQLGSMLGPGGFSSLQSMIQMVAAAGKAVAGAVKELDTFSTVMKNVDMQVVNFADSMAKGQVDTLSLMKQLSAMNAVSLKPTKEEFAAVSKAATVFSQKTGKDATEVFQQLSDSIIRGTEDGLVPFGIQLDETEDKAKAQKEALQKVVEMYGGLEVKLTNNTQRLYALSNNWGTLQGVLWDFVNQGEGPLSMILDGINLKLGSMNEALTSLPDNTKAYLSSWEYILDNFRLTIGEALGMVDEVDRRMAEMRIQTAFGIDGMAEQGPGLGGVLGNLPDQTTKEPPRPRSAGGTKSKSPENESMEKAFELEKRMAEERHANLQLALGIVDAQEAMVFSAGELYGIEESNVISLEKYKAARESVSEMIDRQMEAESILIEQQAEWDKEQIEFNKRMREEHQARIEAKNAEFEAELAQYGLRGDAIDQIMALNAAERKRALESIQDTHALVKVTGQLNTAWTGVKSAITQVSQAYEQGTKDMTTAQAVFYYVDAIIGAVSEAAKAAASAASYDYLAAALHTTAAAGYVATVAIAASHGGGSGSAGGGGAAQAAKGFQSQSTHTAGRYSGGYNGGQSGGTDVNLIVSMDPTAIAFGALVNLNDRNLRSGDPGFQMAAGT